MEQNDSTKDISIEDDMELLNLDKLLNELGEDFDNKNENGCAPDISSKKFVPILREDSTFAETFSYEINTPTIKNTLQSRNADELDSSDDEEVKNFLERKYNEYGSDINKRLKDKRESEREKRVNKEVFAELNTSTDEKEITTSNNASHIKNPHNPVQRKSHISKSFQQPAPKEHKTINTAAVKNNSTPSSSIFTDPIFSLRIINPLISSNMLIERMSGRKAIPFTNIAFHIARGDLSKDWVIAGALVHKSPIRMSKTGNPFSVWRLSDLRGEIKCCSLFLFKSAHKELWKTSTGTCLAVLNPTIFDKSAGSDDVACLAIDTAQKVMVLGQSKDFGTCRAKKRNGDACTSIVNLNECDYCIFHMKQEFGKMSKRSEFQSASLGRGLNDLRNKVLGKSEVFYGGQSFTAVSAKKNAKLINKDKERMSCLSEYAISPFANTVNHSSKPKSMISSIPYAERDGRISKIASNVESSSKQRVKDLERLKILQAELENKTAKTVSPKKLNEVEPLRSSTLNTITDNTEEINNPILPENRKNYEFSFTQNSPRLSRESFSIEVNIGQRKADFAKLKAKEVLKKRPIEKMNPNSIRGSIEGKRRAIDELNDKFANNDVKRQKLEADAEAEKKSRIQRIMDATSSHTNLIDQRDREEEDKYFNKLEKKEALEEKLLHTYKMPCKAVICQKCKYTAFSAADICKQEKHPLKVVDAEKRFFQCEDCGNRTATVFKLPKTSCRNCKGSKWKRTGMIREKKICTTSEALSIRGDEELFLGSLSSGTNLNLLVPDQ